jgi:uncharacterized protein YktB (UPF0637 family)
MANGDYDHLIKRGVNVKKNEIKKTRTVGKYVFTQDELNQLGHELARSNRERTGAEDEKKSVMSDFKARIDGLDARINRLSNNISNGFEYKDMECTLELDLEAKKRIFRRIDTNEIIREEEMHPEDWQTEANFG